MNKHESKHEQTNRKPELSPAELRVRLENIVRDLAGLLGQLNGTGAPASKEVGVNGTEDRMLTVDEVAARLGFSRDYVYHQAKDWPFRRKLSHKRLRFSEAGLERWLSLKSGGETSAGLARLYADGVELDDEGARGERFRTGTERAGRVSPVTDIEKSRRGHFSAAVTAEPAALTRADVSVDCLYRVERSPLWAWREVPRTGEYSGKRYSVLEPIPELWEPFLAELQAEADRKSVRWSFHPTAALGERRRRGTCVRCGARFVHSHKVPVKYCSKRCQPTYQKSRTRIRTARPCAHCGIGFLPTRAYARTCSPRCRVAAHRARQR